MTTSTVEPPALRPTGPRRAPTSRPRSRCRWRRAVRLGRSSRAIRRGSTRCPPARRRVRPRPPPRGRRGGRPQAPGHGPSVRSASSRPQHSATNLHRNSSSPARGRRFARSKAFAAAQEARSPTSRGSPASRVEHGPPVGDRSRSSPPCPAVGAPRQDVTRQGDTKWPAARDSSSSPRCWSCFSHLPMHGRKASSSAPLNRSGARARRGSRRTRGSTSARGCASRLGGASPMRSVTGVERTLGYVERCGAEEERPVAAGRRWISGQTRETAMRAASPSSPMRATASRAPIRSASSPTW